MECLLCPFCHRQAHAHTMYLLSIYLNRFNVWHSPAPRHYPPLLGYMLSAWEYIIHVESLLFNYPSKSLFITRTAFCTLIISITRKLYLEMSVHKLRVCVVHCICVCHGYMMRRNAYMWMICGLWICFTYSHVCSCSRQQIKFFVFFALLFNSFRQFSVFSARVCLCVCSVHHFTLSAWYVRYIYLVRSWFVLARFWRCWSSGYFDKYSRKIRGQCSINGYAERCWHRPGACTMLVVHMPYKYFVPFGINMRVQFLTTKVNFGKGYVSMIKNCSHKTLLVEQQKCVSKIERRQHLVDYVKRAQQPHHTTTSREAER